MGAEGLSGEESASAGSVPGGRNRLTAVDGRSM